ncbi:hypothetical protein ACT44T_13810 [Acinetobacter baumannii]
MTIPVSDRLSQLYVGNGTNTRFDFTFRVFEQEDATGVAVRKKTSTDFETVDPNTYTVNLNQDGMGGFVIFNEAPAVGTYFYIAGATPLDQLLDITNYDNFYPEAVERALDKLTALLQEWGTQLDIEKQARILADIHYDTLAMEREDNLENRLISYINSVIGITNPKIFDGITDRMVITKDGRTQREFNESIPFWTDDYVNFKQATYIREEKILNHAIQINADTNTTLGTAISTEISRATSVEQSLQMQINANGIGNKAYKTYAEMDADKANIPANSKVSVTNDPDPTKNIDYQWDGSVFTPSGKDSIKQANEYTDNAIRNIESNRFQNINKLTYDQVAFNVPPTSVTGNATYVTRNGIKQLKVASAGTGGEIKVYWDIPVAQFKREFSGSICVEGLTAGKDGLVGIQQINASGRIVSPEYAETQISAAVTKKTFKPKTIASVDPTAVLIRLIVHMLTDTTREMYVHSPFIADGINAEFIAPPDTKKVDSLYGMFHLTEVKNKFNPTLAQDNNTVQYSDGTFYPRTLNIALGKQAVKAGQDYIFWMPINTNFAFFPVIYTYAANGTYLGIDHSVGGAGEKVNQNPPTGIAYADGNRTVKFTIPANSQIAFIQLRTADRSHTAAEFNSLINSMQMEYGGVKTDFVPYDPRGDRLVIDEANLPDISASVAPNANTFTVTLDGGTDAYIRTSFNDTLDLVQQVSYATSESWDKNNIINFQDVRTIAKSTPRESVIAAFANGTTLVSQSDDATPLRYNGTYIGANHGAGIVHQVTVNNHGKTFVDVGSRWTQGATTYTLIRIVDANRLWLVSQNIGTTYWVFTKASLTGLLLTHSAGATNISSFTPSDDVNVQLRPAINNHTRKVIADGYRELTEEGTYDVESVEFIDNYDIMNPPSILSYLQSKTGTPTEQIPNNNSIASDMRVSNNYRYALNGSVTVSTQIQSKAIVNFEWAGITQALPLKPGSKTLLQYVPKVLPIAGNLKTWDFANLEDISGTIERIDFTKARWANENDPPDKMAQIVRNGSNNEFGNVVGYVTNRGIGKPEKRVNTSEAGFIHDSKKMYPHIINGAVYPSGLIPVGTVLNAVAYRSIYSSSILPQATVFTWFQDNNAIYVVFDIHQNASMLKLPLNDIFNGKSAEATNANSNFTLHSEIVSDGGLLCSVINGYGRAIIKLT